MKPVWILIFIGTVLIGLSLYLLIKKQEPQVIYVQATPSPVQTPLPTRQLDSSLSNKVQLTVNGTDKWKDSGLTAKRGQTIKVSASGSVVWDEALPAVGPEGSSPASKVERPSDFPMPQAACGSLVMRIGSSLYAVGADDTVTASEEGTIKFIVNDRYDYLWNNRGSFLVQVEVR